MDDSVGLSRGLTLRDLHNHPNLKQMIVEGNDFVAEKIRGEQFRFSTVEAEGTLAFTQPQSSTLITLGVEWLVVRSPKDAECGTEPVQRFVM
jgi:hypothetical protein